MEARSASARQKILETQELPPLPNVAAELLMVLQADDDNEVERLRVIVEQDPGLTARVMGWANSAYFGTRGNVRTLDRAIFGVLGLRTVTSLILSIILNRAFNTQACPSFQLEDYWFRALLTAHCARSGGARAGGEQVDPEDAFLAGLLHNLGLLLLVHLFPGDMDAVLKEANAPDDAVLRAAEQERLGIDHAQAGAWLAQRWHLPALVVDTISGYPQSPPTNSSSVVGLVGFSRNQVDRLLASRAKRAERVTLTVPDWLCVPREEWREVVVELLEHRDKLREQAQSLS
ncbi:HDOD domain-containing protein [Thiohalorhabdus sp. Cl-TMA]|uniref:HDOD domain-containing protein n=1 Tax=Thiohalorhabdus methylotrophus TaxID=3242694 RepID=A0ABV4TUZ2_9GAMM